MNLSVSKSTIITTILMLCCVGGFRVSQSVAQETQGDSAVMASCLRLPQRCWGFCNRAQTAQAMIQIECDTEHGNNGEEVDLECQRWIAEFNSASDMLMLCLRKYRNPAQSLLSPSVTERE